MKTLRKNWLWIVIAAIALVLAVPVAVQFISGSSNARAAVQTGQVSRGNIQLQVLSSAALQPAADLQLTFGTSGTLSDVLVKPGDHVEKGAPIARLDPANLQLAVKQA